MRWLPVICLQGTSICAAEFEAEGTTLHVRWGRFVFEVTFARVQS